MCICVLFASIKIVTVLVLCVDFFDQYAYQKKKIFSRHGISRNARHWTRCFSQCVYVCVPLVVHSRFSFNAQSLVFFFFGLIKRLRPIHFVYIWLREHKDNKKKERKQIHAEKLKCLCVSLTLSLFFSPNRGNDNYGQYFNWRFYKSEFIAIALYCSAGHKIFTIKTATTT